MRERKKETCSLLLLKLLVVVLGNLGTPSFSANVTYDHRSLLIGGKRRVLSSGSIHYPRSTTEVSSLSLSISV